VALIELTTNCVDWNPRGCGVFSGWGPGTLDSCIIDEQQNLQI